MIALPFDPDAVRVGPLVLTWHGLFTAAGIVVGLQFASTHAPRAGLTADSVVGAAWWVIAGGVAGARLLYAAEHADQFAAQPLRLLALNEGGISVFGAVLGGAAGAAFWAKRARAPALQLLDAVAPGFLLGQAIGRIGDVVNGEHLGVHAAGLPWAVVYTHPNTLGELGVPVHPAVAYELVWDLLAAALASYALRRGSPGAAAVAQPGTAFWLALLLYGTGRLWTGFFRLDASVALGLGLAQLIGLASIPVSVVGLVLARRTRLALPPTPH